MKKQLFFTVVFFTLMLGIANAQDYYFSMPYSNPLNMNPAFAGAVGCSRLCAGYNFNGDPFYSNIFHLSYDQYVDKIKGGFGGTFSYDFGNNYSCSIHTSLVYSPTITIRKKITIKPAAEVAYGYSEVSIRHECGNVDPNDWFCSKKYFDASVSILSYSKRLFGGIVINHFAKPRAYPILECQTSCPPFIYFSPLDRTLTAHFGAFLKKQNENTMFQIIPSIIYIWQGDYEKFIFCVDAKYKRIRLGVHFNNYIGIPDTFSFCAGYDFKKFKIAYSFSTTVPGLSYYVTNSQEISLQYKFNCKNKEDKIMPLNLINF